MDDLIYRWKEGEPVQIAGGAKELPGGFKLDGFGDQNCDVITATGENYFNSVLAQTVCMKEIGKLVRN